MKSNRHKRKTKHILLVTSDSASTGVTQYLYKPAFLWGVILLLCVVLGVLSAYFISENKIWEAVGVRNEEQLARIEQLEMEADSLREEINKKEQEKSSLNTEIENLNQQIKLLSDTVNEKVQSEAELVTQIEKQSIPTLFPLTGSAVMKENSEDEIPNIVFQASVGSTVVATASGKVTEVTEDSVYGRSITVDHGNGYMTIYKNQGDTNIKIGDSVVQGTTLFLISKDNTNVCYMMMKDGGYINPVDMIVIDG